MLSCRMRLALMAVIVCYSVGSQSNAATVLYPNGLSSNDNEAQLLSVFYTSKIDWKLQFLGQIRDTFMIARDGFVALDNDDVSDSENNFVNLLNTNLKLETNSRVWWRLTNDTTTLSQVTQDIQPYFSAVGSYTFNAKWALIVTWYKVSIEEGQRWKRDTAAEEPILARTKRDTAAENTFQLIIATDGLTSYAMFNYQNILSSIISDIQIGFDFPGNGFYNHPLSTATAYTQLMTRSNVGVAGRWLYRVDGRGVLDPDCAGYSISTETGTNFQVPFRVINVPDTCSNPLLKSTSIASSFLLVPCNARDINGISPFPNQQCVSIVSVFAPNMFIRHGDDSTIQLCISDETVIFKKQSSFLLRPNTFKDGFFALQSYNNPDQYIQVLINIYPSVKITLPDNPIPLDYNQTASFTLGILPGCPSADKATWCSTIKSELCSQAPFGVLCRATCDVLTATTTATTTQPTTTTKGVGVLKLTKCARPAYRIANPEFCKNWNPFNRRLFPARWSNWAGRGAGPWAGRGAGRGAGRRFW